MKLSQKVLALMAASLAGGTVISGGAIVLKKAGVSIDVAAIPPKAAAWVTDQIPRPARPWLLMHSPEPMRSYLDGVWNPMRSWHDCPTCGMG